MKIFSIFILGCIVLTGCAGAVIESARISVDTTLREKNIKAALKGDPEAQYQVGKSYCCAPRNNVDAFYNNRKAIEYLCQSARQNHALAAYELGKIYTDETITGVRLLRRVTTALRGDDLTNTAVAYYWFKQAQLNGYEEATSKLEALGSQDISQFTDPETAPCSLDEVLGDNKNN